MSSPQHRTFHRNAGLVIMAALTVALVFTEKAFPMTCNIARPYNPKLSGAVPVFSRIRPNLLFEAHDDIEFFVFSNLRPLRVAWELRRNLVNTPFLSGVGEVGMDQSVRIVIPSDGLAPGFYDAVVTVAATESDRETRKVAFGYRIDEIPLVDTRPADFEAFWAAGVAAADALPLNAAETFIREMKSAEVSAYNVMQASIPEHVDPAGERFDTVRVYKVQFDAPGEKRMHGWLTVPVGEGPFPGMLVLPGAGVAALPAPVEHARHGYVTLMLQIHGMDVDQESYKSPADYLKVKGGAPEDEYYYHVYLACAQAIRYLAERPEVDASRMTVAGGSQGGQLAIVTGALRPAVTAVVSAICYYAYWPLRDQVAALNAQQDSGVDAPVPPAFDPGDARQRNLSYYDPINFAPMVRGATLMAVCLNDGPSPSPTVHAVYRQLSAADKELQWSAGTNHDLMFAFERRAWEWVDGVTGYDRSTADE